MRIFYAVNFDSKTSAALKELQNSLREHVRHGRWASVENLHLTLHFVGEIEEERLPFFKTALETAAEAAIPFSVRFTSFGSFRQGREDLIYVKTKNSGDTLQTVSAILKEQVNCGDMKPFKPHITLVRRAEINYKTLKVLKKQRFELPPARIKSIELMESKKTEGRLVYLPLYSVNL